MEHLIWDFISYKTLQSSKALNLEPDIIRKTNCLCHKIFNIEPECEPVQKDKIFSVFVFKHCLISNMHIWIMNNLYQSLVRLHQKLTTSGLFTLACIVMLRLKLKQNSNNFWQLTRSRQLKESSWKSFSNLPRFGFHRYQALRSQDGGPNKYVALVLWIKPTVFKWYC